MSISNLSNDKANEVRASLIVGSQIQTDEFDTQNINVADTIVSDKLSLNEFKINKQEDTRAVPPATDITGIRNAGEIIIQCTVANPLPANTSEDYIINDEDGNWDTSNNLLCWLGGGSSAGAILSDTEYDTILNSVRVCARNVEDNKVKIRVRNISGAPITTKIVVSWMII
jgi:hypothetical protein